MITPFQFAHDQHKTEQFLNYQMYWCSSTKKWSRASFGEFELGITLMFVVSQRGAGSEDIKRSLRREDYSAFRTKQTVKPCTGVTIEGGTMGCSHVSVS